MIYSGARGESSLSYHAILWQNCIIINNANGVRHTSNCRGDHRDSLIMEKSIEKGLKLQSFFR